ncbi:MAG: mce related protein [Spirochaetes bacterium ADurb.Bin269]|nr:MAG: mce related protein [Spirochaetes bacterium ADurb.Bin269]
MKFKIRYADQIVGAFTILAFVALIAVIFLLGSKQRWFSRDYRFTALFDTATGLGNGMPLQYKGFTIGKIKTVALTDDDKVNIEFVIFDTYYSRAKEGSLVELIVNPIGLGNQFLFHPGNGTALIAEGSRIPRADTPEGKDMIAQGLVSVPKRDDTITNLIAQINPLLTNINDTLSQVSGAFSGSGKGPLADTMRGVGKTLTEVSGALDGTGSGPLARTLSDVSSITGQVDTSLAVILGGVEEITATVNQITSNLEQLSSKLTDPANLVPTLIDADGTLFASIEASFNSVQGTLANVESSSLILKSQVPQIARLIEDLRLALVKGQDVLEALKNNPILKNGVPERIKTDSSGTNSRNIEF